MRIAILSAFHETNTFSTISTDKKNFQTNTWLYGQDILSKFENTKTPIGGFIDAIQKNGHTAVPLFAAHATPAGTVQSSVFSEIRTSFKEELLKNKEIDAVAVELHGAHVVEGLDDPEAVLLSDIKDVLSEKPIAVVTDFHANMTASRLINSTVWAGYMTNPHIDTYEAAIRSLEHLFYYLENKITPKYSFVKVPIIYPPIGQATDDKPFAELIQNAERLRTKYGLRDLIVHGGYSFSDIDYAGLSFTALGDETNEKDRETALLALAELAWSNKQVFSQEILDVPQVVERSQMAMKAGEKIAIADIADNINGGSAGDSTHVIREYLNFSEVKILGTICDPGAVNKLSQVALGDELELSLGGWSDSIAGEPLKLRVKLLWRGDGTYTHEGKMNLGAEYTIGDAALVRINNTDLLIQSFAQQPNDLAQFKIAGIDPEDYQIIILKGAAALRANWSNKVNKFFNASSPGMTDCILERISYNNLGDFVWPINKNLIPDFKVIHLN